MKLFFTISLLLGSLITSASELCTVKTYADIIQKDGYVYDTVIVSNGSLSKTTKDWKECFKLAQALASKIVSAIPLTISEEDISVNVSGFIYIKWIYNDSLFADSQGLLTKLTPKKVQIPVKGDVRVFSFN